MNKIYNNKKGVFFTFVAIFFIVLIISVVSTQSKFRYREKSNAIQTRINTMNTFVMDFEKDVSRELFIGGYRSLISLNAYIRDIETYIEDMDLVFTEILINGTANNTQMALMTQDGFGADVTNWLVRVNEEAEKLNIIVNIIVNDVTLTHITPWDVRVGLNLSIKMIRN